MSTFSYLLSVDSGDVSTIQTGETHSPFEIIVQNVGADNVYLGQHDVATDHYGLKLTPGMGVSMSLNPSDGLWATSDGSSTLSVLKTSGKRS